MGTKEWSTERYCGTWYHIITKLKKWIREGSTLTMQNSWKHVWLTVLGNLNFTAFWKDKTINTAKRVVAVRDWRRRVEMRRWNSVLFQDGKAVQHNTITVDMSLYSCQSQRTYNPDSELSCKLRGTPLFTIICHFYIQLFMGKPKSQARREMGYLEILSFLISFLQI